MAPHKSTAVKVKKAKAAKSTKSGGSKQHLLMKEASKQARRRLITRPIVEGVVKHL